MILYVIYNDPHLLSLKSSDATPFFTIINISAKAPLPVMQSSQSSWFWNEDIWLPPGITWDTMKQAQSVNNTIIYPEQFAQFGDLLYPLPLALLMILVRWVVERLVFRTIGLRIGLRHYSRPYPTHNNLLEEVFKKNKSLANQDLISISSQTGLSIIQVRQRQWAFYSVFLVSALPKLIQI